MITISFILLLLISSLFVNPKGEYTQNSRFYRWLLHTASGAAIKLLGIRVHVTGMEKVPSDTRFLLVSNHRSNYDPILTWQVFKDYDLAFVSKPENFKIPMFGRIIRKCCFLPIDREDPRKAIVTINKAADLIKADTVSVGIYPEGTRHRGEEMLPFHNGVFKIAKKADVPIVIVSVSGTDQICHRLFRGVDVQLRVLDVIPAETVAEAKTAELGDTVRTIISHDLGRITHAT